MFGHSLFRSSAHRVYIGFTLKQRDCRATFQDLLAWDGDANRVEARADEAATALPRGALIPHAIAHRNSEVVLDGCTFLLGCVPQGAVGRSHALCGSQRGLHPALLVITPRPSRDLPHDVRSRRHGQVPLVADHQHDCLGLGLHNLRFVEAHGCGGLDVSQSFPQIRDDARTD